MRGVQFTVLLNRLKLNSFEGSQAEPSAITFSARAELGFLAQAVRVSSLSRLILLGNSQWENGTEATPGHAPLPGRRALNALHSSPWRAGSLPDRRDEISFRKMLGMAPFTLCREGNLWNV